VDEAAPFRFEDTWWRRDQAERADRVGRLQHAIEDALRCRRTDAGHQLEQAETSDAVARVLGEAQQSQQILDVGGVKKLEAAELDERNIVLGELDLERP